MQDRNENNSYVNPQNAGQMQPGTQPPQAPQPGVYTGQAPQQTPYTGQAPQQAPYGGQVSYPGQAPMGLAQPAKGYKPGRFRHILAGFIIGILLSSVVGLFLPFILGYATLSETFTGTTDPEEFFESYTGSSGSSFAPVTESEDAEGSAINDEAIEKLRFLEELMDDEFYGDPVDDQTKRDNIYQGLVNSLGDPYAVYYNEADWKQMVEDQTGLFFGVGAYITLNQQTGNSVISGTVPDSPAEKAGLMADDIITEVDGESVAGLSLDEVVQRIRGEEGVAVTVTVYRPSEDDYLDFTMVRTQQQSHTVETEMLDGGIGHLTLTGFEEVSVQQFKDGLSELRSQGMKGLILDLRGNPGGDVDACVAIASQIIPDGLVFYSEDNQGNRIDYHTENARPIDIPLVVLVDGYSASAAEILTGAIQDSEIGTIMGTQTYGKGIVQSVWGFRDGTGIKFTTEAYFTRGGQDIHHKGITPDIEVELDSERYRETGEDNQLEEAVREVTRLMNGN